MTASTTPSTSARSTSLVGRHQRRVVAVALTALVLAAACGSSGPSPSTSPTGPASPPASPTGSVPATPAPSAAVVCDDTVTGGPAATMDPAGADATTYDEIEHQVEELRALNATAPVARGVFDQAGLCAYLRTSFATDNPDALVAATETLYKRMLLLPATASLKDLYLALLTSQVAGLYDNKTRTMYVVSSSGNLGPTEEITYAHEFTHALQDQHFDLKKLMGDATDQSDRSMARSTLVEGDATLLMSLWAQAHLTPAELGQIAGSVDPASTALLESMPAILKDPLLFPYTSGLNVAMGAFTTGGFGGVDAMFSAPPESTEQVMHPEKLASREAPVIVSFPSDLATRLGAGWKVSMQDTFGELLLGIILREGGATAPEDAAAGWGGDRVALLEGSGGKVAVVMDASWDTAADADQYAAALEPMVARLTAAGQSAAVLRPSEKRVVLVSAESADTMGRVANVLGLAG